MSMMCNDDQNKHPAQSTENGEKMDITQQELNGKSMNTEETVNEAANHTEAHGSAMIDTPTAAAELSSQPASAEVEVERATRETAQMLLVLDVFPAADDKYVRQELAEYEDQQLAVEHLIQRMLTDGNYPRRVDREKKQLNDEKRSSYFRNFNVAELLRRFEDPEAYFNDPNRKVSENYVKHAMTVLRNYYVHCTEQFLTELLKHHNNLFIPTFNYLREHRVSKGAHQYVRDIPQRLVEMSIVMPARRQNKRAKPELWNWPEEIDDQFFWEYQYSLNRDVTQETIGQRRMARAQTVSEARDNNLLKECDICARDDVLPDEMLNCGKLNIEGLPLHPFCNQCLVGATDATVSEGGHNIGCLYLDCNESISHNRLQNVIKPEVLDRLLRAAQRDELRMADIENIESCPFCDFSVINENKENRVFKCLNPKCLKDSCRDCHQRSHIPLKCAEVGDDVEVHYRTYVENKMAEALIRKCPVCNIAIIKSHGCNLLTCLDCRAHICYVCKQQIHDPVPYEHFITRDPNSKCALHTTGDEVHANVSVEAGREAEQAYAKEHPERAAALQEKWAAAGPSAATKDPAKTAEGAAKPIKIEVEQLVDREQNQQPEQVGGVQVWNNYNGIDQRARVRQAQQFMVEIQRQQEQHFRREHQEQLLQAQRRQEHQRRRQQLVEEVQRERRFIEGQIRHLDLRYDHARIAPGYELLEQAIESSTAGFSYAMTELRTEFEMDVVIIIKSMYPSLGHGCEGDVICLVQNERNDAPVIQAAERNEEHHIEVPNLPPAAQRTSHLLQAETVHRPGQQYVNNRATGVIPIPNNNRKRVHFCPNAVVIGQGASSDGLQAVELPAQDDNNSLRLIPVVRPVAPLTYRRKTAQEKDNDEPKIKAPAIASKTNEQTRNRPSDHRQNNPTRQATLSTTEGNQQRMVRIDATAQDLAVRTLTEKGACGPNEATQSIAKSMQMSQRNKMLKNCEERAAQLLEMFRLWNSGLRDAKTESEIARYAANLRNLRKHIADNQNQMAKLRSESNQDKEGAPGPVESEATRQADKDETRMEKARTVEVNQDVCEEERVLISEIDENQRQRQQLETQFYQIQWEHKTHETERKQEINQMKVRHERMVTESLRAIEVKENQLRLERKQSRDVENDVEDEKKKLQHLAMKLKAELEQKRADQRGDKQSSSMSQNDQFHAQASKDIQKQTETAEEKDDDEALFRSYMEMINKKPHLKEKLRKSLDAEKAEKRLTTQNDADLIDLADDDDEEEEEEVENEDKEVKQEPMEVETLLPVPVVKQEPSPDKKVVDVDTCHTMLMKKTPL